MIRITTKRTGKFAVLALALGMIFSVACTSQPGPGGEAPGTGPGTGGQLGGLLPEQASQVLRAGFAGSSLGSADGSSGVWVSGTGEASAAPDVAILSMGLEALADTVSESRSQAAEAMAASIAVMQEQGVALEDIQTRSFNINPRYTYQEVTRCNGSGPATSGSLGIPEPSPDSLARDLVAMESLAPSITSEPIAPSQELPGQECYVEHEQVLMGFQVSNQLTVKVRDLDDVGEVIDRVTDAGGDLTRFQNVNFTIEDTQALQDQARESAIQAMQAKAEQIAAVAGLELGDLVYLTETGGPGPISMNASRAVMAMAESAPTPILGGEMKVSVTVQGAFTIAGGAAGQ